ncbi:MAG: iron-containing alcohol dehydrogenase [Muribaculaceae bacterium]|nr:iron-containing alcohol dehydrogenase [Muribaculaceae bacterium]
MNAFTYHTPTRYVFGPGAECRAGEELAALGLNKVLVVSGHSSARRSGVLGRVTDALTASSIEWTELCGIDPNPTDIKVRQGIEICRSRSIDGILAVGGGSVIDTAKAIAAGVPYDGDFWDFWAGKAVVKEALPVAVVLTIPAAGSEGSGNSVITLSESKRKISLRTDVALRPKVAMLNPELTFTLPPEQTAAGIADMMAHIMERYFSPTPDVAVTDRVSEGVLQAIVEEAPKVMADPTDYQARANIMWCGTLAHNGVCGTGCAEDWSSHAIEHEISALYGVAHGAGLAVVFPAYLTYVSRTKPAKVAQLGRRVFGVGESDDRVAADMAVTQLREFFGSLGLPLTMRELGIANPDITYMVERLHQNKGKVIGSYLPLDAEATAEIYRIAK